MVQEVLQFIRQHRLIKNDDQLLLAVSGGLDSMVMLHILHQLKYTLAVAHCNFNLRGEESDLDAELVETACAEMQIPFYSKRFETEVYAEQQEISIQMAARDLRYAWFYELAQNHGYHKICTAHHASDQAETILFNLIRGTGVVGLKGIPVKNNLIVRPLLHQTRKQLEDYVKKNKLRYRTDSSNLETDYHRNFLRINVIPQVKKINPAFDQSMFRFSELMTETAILMEERIMQLLEGLVHFEQESILLNVATLKDHPALKTLIYHFLKNYNFNADQSAMIAQSLNGSSGKQFYSESHRLLIDRNQLILQNNTVNTEQATIQIDDTAKQIILPEGTLELTYFDAVRPEMLQNKDPETAFLDAGKIKFPLSCRKWQKGDYFYPLGMDHRRKLSDYFIDQKLSLNTKKNVRLLLNNDEIIWIAGYRIDQRYRITDLTTAVLSLHWKSYGSSGAI
ncbi:tRNA lysidine(34) synthetase TilS [soil metagenome]